MASKPSKEVLRVAQELSFARALASNDKALRDRALKRLNKWFSSMPAKKESFTEESFTRLWKGLYYCVWMSDKPLIQEDCVERITKLVLSLKNFKDTRKFVRCFFRCMSQAWFNLDSFRIDKYLMLVRRFLRQLLERLRQSDWNIKSVQAVMTVDLLAAFSEAPLGLNIHIAEIFLEELAKIGRGKLPSEVLFEFVKPFGEMFSKTKDDRLMKTIADNVFLYLLRQSEEGLKHQSKFEAWRQAGFAGGDIDMMEEVGNDEMEDDWGDEDRDIIENGDSDIDDDEDTPLDPRAGRVDVMLPPLEFDAAQIIDHLAQLKTNPALSTKARKQVNFIISKYKTYQAGKYPLGIHKVEIIEPEDEDELVEKAALKLATVEQKLIAESDVNGDKKFKFPQLDQTISRSRKRKSSCTWVTTPSPKEESISDSPATEGEWTVSPSPVDESVNGATETSEEYPDVFESLDKHEDTGATTPSIANFKMASRKSLISVGDPEVKKVNRAKKKKMSVLESLDSSWGDSLWESFSNEIEIPLTPMRSNASVLDDSNFSSLVTPHLNGLSSKVGSAKKVEFALTRNTSQEEKEYRRSVKKRPSRPFDAQKKPFIGVLKQTPTNSPILQLDKFPPSLAEIS